MALVKCKECGSRIAATAKACPNCGAKPPKKTSVVTWGVLIIIGLGVIGSMTAPRTGTQPVSPEVAVEKRAAEEASRKAREAEQRKVIAVARAKDFVKAKLKDPESARFGQVVAKDSGMVCGYVNAKNSFGGYTGEKAFISLSADLTWLEGETADFESTWNQECATK